MASLTESAQSFCWKDFLEDRIYSNTFLINASILLSTAVLFTYLGYLALTQMKNILWYQFMKSVEVTSTVQSCQDMRTHLLDWLQNNAETKSLPHLLIDSSSRREDNGEINTELNNYPNFATSHYFTYKGHWVIVRRDYLRDVICNNCTYESITLSTFRSNSWILEEIMEEVRLKFHYQPEVNDKTRFYYATDGYWAECGQAKRKRPLASVILSETVLSKINSDVHEFLETEKWYQDRGIPYRRGYLLYGPPGCGKSSFVKAIAGEINFSICMLSLSSKNLNDDSLNNLMNSTPESAIILLEDIDAAFPNRKDNEDEVNEAKDKPKKPHSIEVSENGTGKVTLRGLLNALDGVASTEGRIIFLTTNYIERLDSAMTRPGRVDLKVHIDLPDDDQLLRMFTRFYPQADADTDGKKFVQKIRALKNPKVTMAMIQGHFMLHKYNFSEMMAGIEQYFEEQFFSLKEYKS